MNSSFQTASNKFALVNTLLGLLINSSNISNSLTVKFMFIPFTCTCLLSISKVKFLWVNLLLLFVLELENALYLLNCASTLAKTSFISNGLLIKSSAPIFNTPILSSGVILADSTIIGIK